MALPSFLLRKLYKKGSLRETGPGRFRFTIQNPLADATIVAPPEITVNGIHYEAKRIKAKGLRMQDVSEDAPLHLRKGASLDISLDGHLMRGSNRITVDVLTKEFGRLELFLEEREAIFCDMHDGSEE